MSWLRFDWDEANVSHLARHAITPAEAEQVLEDAPVDIAFEVVNEEERLKQTGLTMGGRVLTIVSTQRGERFRVITGWEADAFQTRLHFQAAYGYPR